MEQIEFLEHEVPKDARQFPAHVYREGSASRAQIHLSLPEGQALPRDERFAAVLRDVFSGGKFMIANPAHGNEPYRGAVDVGLSVNNLLQKLGLNTVPIVVPNIYGARQERILHEEFPGQEGNILLDDEAGELYKRLLFQGGRYDEHLTILSTQHSEIQDRMQEHFARHFRARNLATGEIMELNGRQTAFDINYGSRLLVSDNSYFAFPVLLSELLEETGESGLPFDHEQLAHVQRIAYDMERKYRQTFLPFIHTFSYQDDYSEDGKTVTPPLKHAQNSSVDVPQESLYVMASGTESQTETVLKDARDLGLTIYQNPFLQTELGTAALPDVVYHPNIVAVYGRMGWGTGWLCQQAGKPFIVPPYEFPDDPEIFFNIQTIQKKRLGVVYEGQTDIVEQALALTGDIERINQEISRRFGTQDGIEFAAQRIVQNLHQRKMEEMNHF